MRELKLDQRLYVKSMVEKFGIEKASRKPACSAVPTLSKADEPQTPQEKKYMLNFPYWEAVRARTWMSTMARPYFTSAVRDVASFCKTPGLAHKKAVL